MAGEDERNGAGAEPWDVLPARLASMIGTRAEHDAGRLEQDQYPRGLKEIL